MFNEVVDIVQFDIVNSRTFKDLWNEIQAISSTCPQCPVFKYFQGLEFSRTKFKDVWEPCRRAKTTQQEESSVKNAPKTVFHRLSWRSLSNLISSSCARNGPLRRRTCESSVVTWDLINSTTRSTVQSTGPMSSLLKHHIN